MKYADFERIHELRNLIAFELTEVERAHEQATNITVHLTGMPHGSGGKGSMIENAVIRGESHLARYLRYSEELENICARLHKECARLNDEQRKVIKKYYVEDKRVGKIAKEMELSERHVFRLKKEALTILCSDFSTERAIQ